MSLDFSREDLAMLRGGDLPRGSRVELVVHLSTNAVNPGVNSVHFRSRSEIMWLREVDLARYDSLLGIASSHLFM